MSIPDDIAGFVDDWLDAWNTHDIERVLAHFADDVVFLSPVAARVIPESRGITRGKDALRSYWTTALSKIPELHFDLVAVYVGVDTVAVNYRNQAGGLVNELLTFSDGLVVRGEGSYLRA
jgi:uncharacterized protein (TIGR02246 family)